MGRKLIWILWPSFLVAGIAEILFFTVIDPQELYLFGETVRFSPLATYSIGFFGFWLVCAASSMTTLLLPAIFGRHQPLSTQFLREGELGSVAVTFGVHAFTVDAARPQLGLAQD